MTMALRCHLALATMADAPGIFLRLRHDPLACLPALLALAMATISLPARAHTRLLMLCSGGVLTVPLSAPGQPQRPDRECDSACHAGCSREKRSDTGRRAPGSA